MSAIIIKLLLGVIFTLTSIVVTVLIAYYLLVLASTVTGLLGWYNLSAWFGHKVDTLTTRITTTWSIITKGHK